jgi:hypothetical protein
LTRTKGPFRILKTILGIEQTTNLIKGRKRGRETDRQTEERKEGRNKERKKETKEDFFCHFICEETEAQKGEILWPVAIHSSRAKHGSKPDLPNFRAVAALPPYQVQRNTRQTGHRTISG